MRSNRSAFPVVTFLTLLLVLSTTAFAAPSITSLSPTAGPSGTSVTITGNGFGNTKGMSTVTFGGTVASTISWGNKSVVATVPSGLANGALSVVVTVGGSASNSATFTVANPIVISGLSVPSGPSGTQVTITGNNFGGTKGDSTVKFGTTVASTTSWGNTSIVAVVPNGILASTVGVVVTVNNTASNSVNFTVTNPLITSISVNSVLMNSAPENQLITINGANFGATQGTNSSVTFRGTTGVLTGVPSSWSDTAITIPVPTSATTGNIVVTANGIASFGYAFMVVPASQPPGVHFIQGNYAIAGSVPSSITVPFPIAQTAGDLNVAVVGWQGAYHVTSVVDNAGNTYSLAVGPTVGTSRRQSIYYAKNVSSATTNTVTVSFASQCCGPAQALAVDVRIAEYSGLNAAAPLDVVAASTATSATADSGFVTTSNQNDLLVGAGVADGTINAAGSNYTMRVIPVNNAGNNSDILEDRVVTATGSYDSTASLTASTQWVMQMVAFKEAANQAPVVNAGTNQNITLPTNSTTLQGTATDDGLPNNTLTISWTQVSGPGTASFNTPNAAITDVTFPVAGTYVLQLTANDSQLSSSSNVTITVNSQVTASLTLSPTMAGPDAVGASQTMTALLMTGTGPTATPIVGVSVQFNVTGPNVTSGNATTDSTGTGRFTYTGAQSGTDTVQASYSGNTSNTSTVSWLVPAQAVSTSTVFAQFFNYGGSGSFDALPTTTPLFTQFFPSVNFNPPAGSIPGNISGVGVSTHPWTEVVTDVNGNFVGTIVAQGNGFQAGVGSLVNFQAVLTSALTVPSAGNVTFNFFTDDGFIFGVGGGATRVSGALTNPPASGVTPFTNLPVVGAYNVVTAPAGNTVVVHFPGPGTYNYEIDYFECCGAPLVLTMATGQNSTGVPPTGALSLSPTSPASQTAGQMQSFTATVTDASGAALQNSNVDLVVTGANQRQVSTTTDSTGHATLQYTGTNAGTDTVQASAVVSGMGAYSNVVNMTWTVPAGGGVTTFVPQGWIGSPSSGLAVQGQVPITVASGVSLTSGRLSYWPTSSPAAVTILNSNTTGSGTIGTFDATLLASGGYTIQLDAIANGGATQVSQINVTVAGGNKPGRFTSTVTEFKVPLAGIPITISRTYDSLQKSLSEDFGFGWKLNTTIDLAVDSKLNVTFNFNGEKRTFYFTPGPSSFWFAWLQNASYTPEPGFHGKLVSNGCPAVINVQGNWQCFGPGLYQPTLYQYEDPAGRIYTITSSGQLQTIQDLNGNTITVTQNGITSSVGGASVTFQRDGSGRITDIYDTNQPPNNYHYTYDPSTGELASVQYPGLSSAETYVYDTPTQDCPTSPTTCIHLLKSEIDPNGNSSSATYYADGRLKSVAGPQVPDPNGGSGMVQYTTDYSYNLSNNTTTITNPADAQGNRGTITRTDDSFGKPLTVVEQVNASTSRTTTYQYDSKENLVQVVRPCGNPIGSCSDMSGNDTWIYTYDANGFQTSMQGPGLSADSKIYNQFGGIASQTDAANTNTIITRYDPNFNPIQVTDKLNGTPGSPVATYSNYDAMGNYADSTDANGKATHYDHFQTGQFAGYLQDVIRFNNSGQTQERTSYTYDPMGKIKTVTDACGNGSCPDVIVASGTSHVTTNTYDALERLASVLGPDGFTTKYQYDNNSNKTDQFDGCLNNVCQRHTHWDYDALNHVKMITLDDGTTNKFFYDFRGNKTTEIDQLGHVTKYVYDLAGQLTSVTSAFGTVDAGTISYSYDLDARQQTMTDETNQSTGLHTTNSYDPAGRLISVQDPLGNLTSYGYDADGRKTSVTEPNNQAASLKTLYTPDERGRVKRIDYPPTQAQPAGTNALYFFDGMGRVTSSQDQGGQMTIKTYDDVGRLTSVRDSVPPNGNVTQYQYDLNGNLKVLIDANTHTTTLLYDTMNRRVQKKLPIGQHEDYTYDSLGRLKTKVDFNQTTTTTYNYDGLDRLLSKVPSSGTGITFTYTLTGQRQQMTYGSEVTNYTQYDNRDRLLFKSTNEGNSTYTYDAHGNVTSIQSSNANGAWTTYQYDALNRLSQVCDKRRDANCAGAGITTYSYDLTGNLTGYAYPNTIKTQSVFDPMNRLAQSCSATSSPACSAGAKLSNYQYGLGPAGNRLTVSELGGRQVIYGYDEDYRLMSEHISGDPAGNNGNVDYPTQANGGYDAVGNRLSMTSTLNAVPGGSFFYDANDRLTTDGYNNNGNTISRAGTSINYDFENRMTQHGSLMLAYDGDGNRVSETAGGVTTKFLVDDLNPTGLPQILDEIVNGSVTRTYAYGWQRINENLQISGNWTPSFYGYDGHGNVRFLSNTVPSITDSYDFDAFGMPIRTNGTTANQFLYSGERSDTSVGLYDQRARYYNQATGRFLSPDPEEGVADKPVSLHKYLYAGSDPVDNSDPTGREALADALTRYRFTISPWVTRGLVVLGAAIACDYALAGSKAAAYQAAGAFGTIDLVAPCYWRGIKAAAPPVAVPVPIAGTPANPQPPRCKQLRDAVNAAKGVVGGLGGCKPGMSRWELSIRYDAWVALGVARAVEDKVCFNGGNPTHQTEEAKAWQNVGYCTELLGSTP
jgi:RHS repeat-associated protein